MILRPFRSGRSMQRQERSSGTQIMNATQTTAFPAVSSLRSACGKNSLSDYIYVTVSKTSDNASGVLACLKKSDGSKAWEDSSSYAWSSPVCVYNEDGTGKVLYCNSTGDVRLLDGKTGELNDTLSISDGVIEASPAVYDNMAVVGTRDCKIWGIELQ